MERVNKELWVILSIFALALLLDLALARVPSRAIMPAFTFQHAPDIFWTVPFDKAFIKAGQVGSPLILHKPNSRGARSIIDLSYAITGGKRESRLFRKSAKTELRSQAALSLTQDTRPVGDQG